MPPSQYTGRPFLSLILAVLVAFAACDLQGKNKCEGSIPDTWSETSKSYGGRYFSYVRVIEKKKLAICSIPGAGSTWFRNFINVMAIAIIRSNTTMANPCRNLAEKPFYHGTYEAHSNALQCMGIKSLESMPTKNVANMACDEKWKRIVLVRNPYARLLSKFNDKIVRKKTVNLRPHVAADGLNFSAFIGHLAAAATEPENLFKSSSADVVVDDHFRRAVSSCGLRHISYDIIKYENMLGACKSLALDLGISEDPAVQAELEKISPVDEHKEMAKLAAAYSPRDAELVRLYYEEDFRAFSYSAALPHQSLHAANHTFSM